MASSVTAVRAGQIHVPTWTAPADKAAWEKLKVETFESGSPRVIIDADTVNALDSSAFMQRYATELQKHAEGLDDDPVLGLPEGMAGHPEMWKRVSKHGAAAIWQLVAGSIYYADFVQLDPPGDFLKGGVAGPGGLLFDDRGCEAGVFAPHDTFDEICKVSEAGR